MKITIDTKEDSHEDLRKVIAMLQHLVGEHPLTNQPNIFDDSESAPSTDGDIFGNLFDGEPKEPEAKKEEEKEDTPEIIEY